MTTASGHAPAEERVEQMVGNLLRIGVLVAAAVALLGGIAFLIHHGSLTPDHSVFRGQPRNHNLRPARRAGPLQQQLLGVNPDRLILYNTPLP